MIESIKKFVTNPGSLGVAAVLAVLTFTVNSWIRYVKTFFVVTLLLAVVSRASSGQNWIAVRVAGHKLEDILDSLIVFFGFLFFLGKTDVNVTTAGRNKRLAIVSFVLSVTYLWSRFKVTGDNQPILEVATGRAAAMKQNDPIILEKELDGSFRYVPRSRAFVMREELKQRYLNQRYAY